MELQEKMSLSEWENIFRSWVSPPSETEQTKADNAERAIKEAIRDYPGFSTKTVTVFKQGSYRALTNVRQDSDVDICACMQSTFCYDLPSIIANPRDYGISPGTGDNFSSFKSQVEGALAKKFGRQSIKRGDKAFDIHENSYRLNADVLAAFQYRWYNGSSNNYGQPTYYEGIKFFTDLGVGIINWPEQSYQNGVSKNKETSYRCKAMIRVIKRLRNYMQEKGIAAAKGIASSLIEGLV